MKTPEQITKTLCDKAFASLRKTFTEVFLGGILAGTFVGLAATTSITVCADMMEYFGSGFTKLISGVVFSLGLIIIVLSGSELFTGSNLFIVTYYRDRRQLKKLLLYWCYVYISNFIGAVLLVYIIIKSGIFDEDIYVNYIMRITNSKLNMSFTQAFLRGLLCNFLVCLAVRVGEASEDVIGKVAVFIYIISAFVINSFEHSIANMFFIPLGIFYGARRDVFFTWTSFLFKNLLPVTIGNIVGGALFVATVYYIMHKKYLADQA